MDRKLFYAPRAPRPPRVYGGGEAQGYALAVVMFAVAALVLAVALRLVVTGLP